MTFTNLLNMRWSKSVSSTFLPSKKRQHIKRRITFNLFTNKAPHLVGTVDSDLNFGFLKCLDTLFGNCWLVTQIHVLFRSLEIVFGCIDWTQTTANCPVIVTQLVCLADEVFKNDQSVLDVKVVFDALVSLGEHFGCRVDVLIVVALLCEREKQSQIFGWFLRHAKSFMNEGWKLSSFDISFSCSSLKGLCVLMEKCSEWSLPEISAFWKYFNENFYLNPRNIFKFLGDALSNYQHKLK